MDNIKAVLLDVDGTLVVSEPVSNLALLELFKREWGIVLSHEDILPFFGTTDDHIFTTLNKRFGIEADISKQKDMRSDIYDSLADRIVPVAGAVDYIRRCKENGLKVALATSAVPRQLACNLRALGMSVSDFDFVINGSMVSRSKPAPDIFLAAAAGVGCKPGECLVIEDSINGHLAAKAAGCPSIGILGSFSEEEQKAAGALYAVADFTLIG